ncbi:hypothetical protein TUM12370_29040 [Salmonella enterica subsp. enterica serovar Choleraesuis]|nr:hypothetical protein TUM12370_29040 [Salmonella enterica subsp. enterica serovar Choleraesuis]
MNASMAILTIGIVPDSGIIPRLIPDAGDADVSCISLLGSRSRAHVLAEYAPQANEQTLYTTLEDGQLIALSHSKIERDLQGIIEVLEHQGVEVIWLMTLASFSRLSATNAVLLEPQRLIPPLVASIVDGHQIGVLLPFSELQESQAAKWQALATPPVYATWNALVDDEAALLAAGKELLANGAEVLVLDCPGYQPADCETLEQHLDMPVLLSSGLMARLAQELLI